jgi:hypothetical protein
MPLFITEELNGNCKSNHEYIAALGLTFILDWLMLVLSLPAAERPDVPWITAATRIWANLEKMERLFDCFQHG